MGFISICFFLVKLKIKCLKITFKRLLLVGLLKYHTLEAYAVLIVLPDREEY